MLFVSLQLIQSIYKGFDVERHSTSEPPLQSGGEMDSTLNMIVEAFLRPSRLERLLHTTDHRSRYGDVRFGAGPRTQQKDDVFRAARHICSQEPGSNVLNRWHGQSSLMEIMNEFGNQMTIENGYWGTLGVKSSPV